MSTEAADLTWEDPLPTAQVEDMNHGGNSQANGSVAPNVAPSAADQQAAFLRSLLEPSIGCAEIRVLEGSVDPRTGSVVSHETFKSTVSCWGDQVDSLMAQAERIEGISAYVTVNPVDRALLARADRLSKQRSVTLDDNIVSLRWLFLDFDVKRPHGISSTEAELLASRVRLNDFLTDYPTIAPSAMWGCSGNGYWLLIRLPDYPSDEQYRGLVGRVTDFLSERHSDDKVELDKATKNPARVMPLVGTVKRKGVSTADRPHRTVTLDTSTTKICVLFDLEKFAADNLPEVEPQAAAVEPHDAFTMVVGGPSAEERARKYVFSPKFPDSVEGQKGHDVLFYVACVLVDGFGLNAQQAMLILRDWNAAKAQPAEDEKQLAHKLADAVKKHPTPSLKILNAKDKTSGKSKVKSSPRQTRKSPAGAQLIENRDGLVPCLHNSLILIREHVKAKVQYDTFRQEILVNGQPVNDQVVIGLTARIEEMESRSWVQEHVRSALIHEAHQNEFSSLQFWLDALRWDGVERINRFFHLGYGCDIAGDASTYHAACGGVLFLSAVARAFRPGAKADVMPVLIGDQGIGKSSGIAKLCPDPAWFADDLAADLSDKNAAEALRGKWLIEFSEFSRINRVTLDVVKSFLTRTSDCYRPPYGRIAMDFPRTNIFIGSTNDSHPLTDQENRRFMPIACKRADLKWIEDNRDQLWAEAVKQYRAGRQWWVDNSAIMTSVDGNSVPTSLADFVAEKQAGARQPDYWESVLEDAFMASAELTMDEVLRALKLSTDKIGKSEQMRIASALRAIGFKRDRVRMGTERQYIWRRA